MSPFKMVLGLSLLLSGLVIAEPAPARAQEAALLQAVQPPPNGVWVDSLDLSGAAVRRTRRARGQTTPPPPLTLSLGGVVYPHGIPLQVNADLAIDLKGQAGRFLAMVGIDDERAQGQGSVIFDVWVDGAKRADSGVMRSGEAPRFLSVDLSGARRLVLAVADAGDGTRDDSAIWGGALILMRPGAAARPETMVCRLASVGPALGVRWVSGVTTRKHSKGISKVSAAI